MEPDLEHQDLMVFDGLCVGCSAFARFVAKHDRAGRFRFVTAQSDTGRALYRRHELDPDKMETNIVIVDGTAHVKMRAMAATLSALGLPWSLGGALRVLPRFIGNPVYDLVAYSRSLFGRRQCLLPSEDVRGRMIE